MRNSWIVFSGLLIATSVGCEQKKSAVEQVAELQLEQRLEAEKNRKAFIEGQKAEAKAEEEAAKRAASVALATKAQADIERAKAETRQAEINAQMERDRPRREALAAAEKLRQEKMAEQSRRVNELLEVRNAFALIFPNYSNGLLRPPEPTKSILVRRPDLPGGPGEAKVEAGGPVLVPQGVGLTKAKISLTELEALMVDVGRATLNPTLRNGPGQNGRLNFQSAKFRETVKGNLTKDMGAVQRYIAGLESFDKDIAEAMK